MRLLQLSPCGILKRRQGGLLLLEGALCVPNSHLFFRKSRGEYGDSRFPALELSLLVLELGFLLLERHPSALQLGGLRLGFPSLLLRCGPPDVTLTGGSRQLLF